MRLAFKLSALLILGVATLLGVDGYLLIQGEVERFETASRERLEHFLEAFDGLVEQVRDDQGLDRVRALIAEANAQDHEVQVRWVWLDPNAPPEARPAIPLARLGVLRPGVPVSLRGIDPEGTPRLYAYCAVRGDGSRPAALEASRSLRALDERARAGLHRILILNAAVVVLSAGIAVLVGVLVIGRPLRALVAEIDRVGHGDFSGRVPQQGHDELSTLAKALNEMAENLERAQGRVREENLARIAALEQLRHRDRLSTVGRLSSGMAHELGTPLNVVAGRAGMLEQGDLPREAVRENAAIIREQAERMTRIIRRLLDFARARSNPHEPVDLGELVTQTIKVLLPLARKQGIELTAEPADGPPVAALGNRSQIQQVIMNLVMNAFDAMPNGGRVTVSSEATEGEPSAEPAAVIRVRDHGSGISEGVREHIFEPFFTTKEVGEGTGLGLSIVHEIVQDHGGRIDVESEVGKGTTFTVRLPSGRRP